MELETHRPRGRGRQVSFSPSSRAAGWRVATQRLASLIAALSAVAILTTAVAPAAQANPGCAAGTVCLWDAAGYAGNKSEFGAAWAQTSYWIPLYTIKNSAQSQFTDRAVWTILFRDGAVQRSDCINPGGFRLGDGKFRANYLWIGARYSRCG